MKLACREYIVNKGIGNHDECIKILSALEMPLTRLVDKNFIQSFSAMVINTKEDIENEWLNDFEILPITNGILPFVWVNLTFDIEIQSVEDLKDFEKEQSLAILGDTYIEE